MNITCFNTWKEFFPFKLEAFPESEDITVKTDFFSIRFGDRKMALHRIRTATIGFGYDCRQPIPSDPTLLSHRPRYQKGVWAPEG